MERRLVPRVAVAAMPIVERIAVKSVCWDLAEPICKLVNNAMQGEIFARQVFMHAHVAKSHVVSEIFPTVPPARMDSSAMGQRLVRQEVVPPEDRIQGLVLPAQQERVPAVAQEHMDAMKQPIPSLATPWPVLLRQNSAATVLTMIAMDKSMKDLMSDPLVLQAQGPVPVREHINVVLMEQQQFVTQHHSPMVLLVVITTPATGKKFVNRVLVLRVPHRISRMVLPVLSILAGWSGAHRPML